MNLDAGTWLRSSDFNSKHAVWVVLWVLPRGALKPRRGIGEFWKGYAWVKLDLVMGWVMHAWNSVLRGRAKMEIALPLGNVTVNSHPQLSNALKKPGKPSCPC